MATWLGRLDGGQLDVMWNFLRFHGDKPSVKEIEGLKGNLDRLRTMMIQKGDGHREGKTTGAELFTDMETVLNNIVNLKKATAAIQWDKHPWR